jgi:hypothetical protein
VANGLQNSAQCQEKSGELLKLVKVAPNLVTLMEAKQDRFQAVLQFFLHYVVDILNHFHQFSLNETHA